MQVTYFMRKSVKRLGQLGKMRNELLAVPYYSKEELNLAEARMPGHILNDVKFSRERTDPVLGHIVAKKTHLFFEEKKTLKISISIWHRVDG